MSEPTTAEKEEWTRHVMEHDAIKDCAGHDSIITKLLDENDALIAKQEQTQDAAMWVVKNFQEWQDSGDGLATLIASISKLATFIKEKP